MDLQAAIRQQTSFSLDFYKAVLHDNPHDNAVFSPLSIALAMAMVGAGAKNATLHQIISVLKLPNESAHEFSSQLRTIVLSDGSQAGGPEITFASGIWADKSLSLKPTYAKVVKEKYQAEVTPSDFAHKADEERKLINNWISDYTKGKIAELLPSGSVDDQTKLIVANGLHMKGAWETKFDPSQTSDGNFYLLNGESVKVPMMRSKKKQLFANYGSFKVLQLPYARGSDQRQFSMYILLPTTRNGLPDLEKELDAALDQVQSRKLRKMDLNEFQLPKFKMSYTLEVPNWLKELGMLLPFSKDADFSEIAESPSPGELYVSNVFHQASIEANEEGTEASAASAATIALKSLILSPPDDFIADHPFLFLIREDFTGVILFVGRVTNPLTR